MDRGFGFGESAEQLNRPFFALARKRGSLDGRGDLLEAVMIVMMRVLRPSGAPRLGRSGSVIVMIMMIVVMIVMRGMLMRVRPR
jgi:hypothetical protein